MPLKNVDNANPLLKECWMDIDAYGQTTVAFSSKKQATNIRSQMGVLRSLARKQAPTLFELTKDFVLDVMQIGPDQWVIRGAKVQRILPPAAGAGTLVPESASASEGASASTDAPSYNPAEHHHNPITLSPTGIPLQMPETFPPQAAQALMPLSEEERKRIAREEDRQRNLDLLKKLGFDKPLKRNPPGDNK